MDCILEKGLHAFAASKFQWNWSVHRPVSCWDLVTETLNPYHQLISKSYLKLMTIFSVWNEELQTGSLHIYCFQVDSLLSLRPSRRAQCRAWNGHDFPVDLPCGEVHPSNAPRLGCQARYRTRGWEVSNAFYMIICNHSLYIRCAHIASSVSILVVCLTIQLLKGLLTFEAKKYRSTSAIRPLPSHWYAASLVQCLSANPARSPPFRKAPPPPPPG